MRSLLFAFAAIGILCATVAAPAQEKKPAPPAIHYGDSCEGAYGICRNEMSIKEASRSLRVYFGRRGLTAVVVVHMGRFIRADIYNGPKYIDSIILDRKTGKMRSID